MPPAVKSSDRGEQIRHRLQNGNKRHITDVRGAMGCYYCWLGEYDKCQQHCQKVHVTPRDTYMNPQSRGPSSTDHILNNKWDNATPFFTAAAHQQSSMYNEAQPGTVHAAATGHSSLNITPGEFVSGVQIPFSHGPESHLQPRGHRYENAIDTSLSTPQRYSNISTRHGIYSLHKPVQTDIPYKHPRGSEWIRATEHTRITVTPSTHCYLAHHKKFVPRDNSAIWSGSLVKNGEVGADERSRSFASRKSRGRRSSSAGVSSRGNSVLGPTSSYLRVTEEEQLSRIASGRYHDAFEMPLPGVFSEET